MYRVVGVVMAVGDIALHQQHPYIEVVGVVMAAGDIALHQHHPNRVPRIVVHASCCQPRSHSAHQPGVVLEHRHVVRNLVRCMAACIINS